MKTFHRGIAIQIKIILPVLKPACSDANTVLIYPQSVSTAPKCGPMILTESYLKP